MPKESVFQIQAPFPPKGDQPQAIEKLVQGARDGLAHQVLLGATGTGKSVAWDEPVTVKMPDGSFFRGPIGQLIDGALGDFQSGDSLESAPPQRWEVLSWDAATGATAWKRITGLSRHGAPPEMFRLEASCGRQVCVTGDHSVYVLRGGEVRLLPGSEVRPGDALPLPERLPAPEAPLTHLDWLQVLGEDASASLWMSQPVLIPAARTPELAAWKKTLAPHYADVHVKCGHVRTGRDCLSLPAVRALRHENLLAPAVEESVRVGTRRRSWPTRLALSPELAFVLGQYLAEGHAADRYALLSVREATVQAELERCLRACEAPFFRRVDGDFVLSSKLWTDLLRTLMGSGAARKYLAPQWPAFSNEFLGRLLRGYFEGDGGVEKNSVTATTASRDLAFDIAEALGRFGIWARVREVRKLRPDGTRGHYWKLTVSGAPNLRLFQEHVGFASPRQQGLLRQLVEAAGEGNTNVDLVPGVGARLEAERVRAGLTHAALAERVGCSRSAIGLIESGERQPSRALFARLCQVLEVRDESLSGLALVRWTPVESIEVKAPATRWVYDFSVADYETFLCGRGGLFVHNTYTACQVIAALDRPALVIAHNKTLAAQLCQEIREFFPDNAVEYFVSYYDYYQPEAYVAHTDTFIEKESSRNEEIDRLRHSATHSISSRRDVIVVASVSCIYGLGTPELYKKNVLELRVGDTIDRRGILEKLVHMQFARNDINLVRGTFRVRGDVLEIHPRDTDTIVRVDTFGDEIESLQILNPLTQEAIKKVKFTTIFPATHFIASEDRMGGALEQIEHDMETQVALFESQGKLIEAQRIKQRVRYDMEMMREVGYCNGIENYSRYLDGRTPGDAPYTLLDYFPKDFVLIVDESHQTLPQLRAMYNGDRARKEVLVDYGFRLPAAFDNRPLKFEEFEHKRGQSIYVSATPGPYEMEHIGYVPAQVLEDEPEAAASAAKKKKDAKKVTRRWEAGPDVTGALVQQIIRPTGLIDPEIFVRPSRGQIDDLLGEIRARTAKGQRVLVTTLTKRMAEDLTDYLKEISVKVNYLHSDVLTMERSQILRELRQGKYDVVVGINLLREGLDLPEVSLVAILDADKEGFLRSDTSLIQTIGRAARHVEGQVIMYADNITGSMRRAMDETQRRREIQLQFNEENGITPQGIQKAIRDDLIAELLADARAELDPSSLLKAKPKPQDIPKMLEDLETEMKAAAASLDFERAAQLRDELLTLRELMKG